MELYAIGLYQQVPARKYRFFFLRGRLASARIWSEFLLHFLHVIITAIVCLAPVIEGQHHRQATYEAMLAERRAERWAGVCRSSSKKSPYN